MPPHLMMEGDDEHGVLFGARRQPARPFAARPADRPPARRRAEALQGNEMPNAVSDWLSRYKEDADEAILELINLILEVAECTGTEGEDAIGEVVDLEDLSLTNNHFQDPPDYPATHAGNTSQAKKKEQRQN